MKQKKTSRSSQGHKGRDVIPLQEIENNKQAPPPGKRIKRYTSKGKSVYE
jgi:hypothetical protein